MPWGKRALFSYCFCGALYFLLLVVRLLPLWGLLFGLLFSLRLRYLGVACFTVRLLTHPFFSLLPALGDESGRQNL